MQKQKKAGVLAAAALTMTAMMSMTVFAGWTMDGGERKYRKDDGSFLSDGWNWIDSDGDGEAECYYFNSDGRVSTSTMVDGSEVNALGAWVKGGVVQTKPVGSDGIQAGSESDTSGSESGNWYNSWYGGEYDPYWYDKDETMSEGDKAACHYYEHYYQYDYDDPTVQETSRKASEQMERIIANPCSETAAKEMAWVEIPVWHLKNGQKIAATAKVQVLSSIADEVKEIFTEIYNGSEQFPIESVGGYSWRSNGLSSNHSSGTAIDINPTQNPQVREDGTVLVGDKWEPGVNPYSIGRDSDVVKAFGSHGWSWGAGFSTKDYMHFDWD